MLRTSRSLSKLPSLLRSYHTVPTLKYPCEKDSHKVKLEALINTYKIRGFNGIELHKKSLKKMCLLDADMIYSEDTLDIMITCLLKQVNNDPYDALSWLEDKGWIPHNQNQPIVITPKQHSNMIIPFDISCDQITICHSISSSIVSPRHKKRKRRNQSKRKA